MPSSTEKPKKAMAAAAVPKTVGKQFAVADKKAMAQALRKGGKPKTPPAPSEHEDGTY